MLLGPFIKKPRIHHKGFLEELTHLKMDRKNLCEVDLPFSDREPERPFLSGNCPNISFVFLQDNHLTKVTRAFAGLPKIQQINLYGNHISKMDCFDECSQLRKLYLEHNRISRLEGLHNCSQLCELSLGH